MNDKLIKKMLYEYLNEYYWIYSAEELKQARDFMGEYHKKDLNRWIMEQGLKQW